MDYTARAGRPRQGHDRGATSEGVPEGLMRIVMLSLHQPFDIRLFEKEASSLAAHGWEVTIVAPHQRNEVVGNIKIEAMPVPRSRWGRLVLMPWRLLFRALQTSADLYHVHDPASM